MGNQFRGRRHIDAVHVRITHGRRCGGKIDLVCPRLAGHLHDLPRGRTTHDRIVDQEDVLALEFHVDRIEFLANRLFARLLSRHDEGPSDIAVLDETLGEADVEFMGQAHRRRPAGVRDRDNDIDLVPTEHALGLARQPLAHAQARLVHEDVIDDRVRPCEIDELEDTRAALPFVGTLARMKLAIVGEDHRLARVDIAHAFKVQGIQRDALGCNHHLGATFSVAHAEHQRADTVRVTERHHAIAGDHRDRGITALTAQVDAGNGAEDVVFIERQA